MMINWLKNLYRKYVMDERLNDPVYNCDVYKHKGCSHVDGMGCDMKTCNILKDYREGKSDELRN